ncbi:DsbA family protein [Sphingomonas sp. GB1N7]|uniref:DsbA family protein n=1 Tax=Parasphingomonas caseinilytica TaxID=3096158 RepID=UPI002FC97906
MKFRFISAILPLIALAACGDNSGTANSGSPAAPVAAAPVPSGQDWTQTVAQTKEGGFVMGNPAAPIKLVEYGSRLCPTCGAFANTGMKPLIDTYVKSGKVSYEFREYLVHGAPDFAPALLGRCVGTTAFFPVLEQMFAAQSTILPKMEDAQAFQATLQGKPPEVFSTAWAEKLGYIDFVKQRGLPEAKARACLTDKAEIDKMVKNMDVGTQMGVSGTPSFFLNGNQLQGAISWEQVEQQLKAAGA